MGEQTQKVGNPDKVYFYYPAYNKKFVRRVLAGIVSDGKLYVAQAALFPGFKPKLIPVKFQNGTVVYVQDPGMKGDIFIKTEGRRIATERVTGIKTLSGGKTANVGRKSIIEVNVPSTDKDFNPGKFFVAVVENYLKEKGFPSKPVKEKKKVSTEPGPAPEN